VSAMVKAHRAHERKSVSWNAKLHQDGCILDCKAVDVSAGGAKIRIDERLPINSWVVLSIDAVGNFPGEVRWQDKSFAGIRFLQDAAVVEERLCDALGAKIAFTHSCEAQGW
jgi:hypothetical protein